MLSLIHKHHSKLHIHLYKLYMFLLFLHLPNLHHVFNKMEFLYNYNIMILSLLINVNDHIKHNDESQSMNMFHIDLFLHVYLDMKEFYKINSYIEYNHFHLNKFNNFLFQEYIFYLQYLNNKVHYILCIIIILY